MSVDVQNLITLTANLPPKITDLLFYYGGKPDNSAEEGTEVTNEGEWDEAAREAKALPRTNRDLKVHYRRGAVGPLVTLVKDPVSTAVDGGIEFLKRNFDPRGKLIMYGFSAGGFNVLKICRKIEAELPFYNFATNTLGLLQALPPAVSGKVIVDLLVTVDASAGLTGNLEDLRSIPACVKLNWNFYQTYPSVHGAVGGPNNAVSGSTRIEQEDLTPVLISRHSTRRRVLGKEITLSPQIHTRIMKFHGDVWDVADPHVRQKFNEALAAP